VSALARVPAPHWAAGGFCLGLSLALAVRCPSAWLATGALLLVGTAALAGRRRIELVALGLIAGGWWLASVRLDEMDRSALVEVVGRSGPAVLEVTGPTRTSRFVTRVPVRVRALWRQVVDEPSQLELPAQIRAPPQGAVIETVVSVRGPRPEDEASGYDEEAYLRRKGAHVVLGAERYRIVGRRGGVAGAADRVRAALAGSIAPGLEGERRALVAGIVLGEDEGLDVGLRERFRASGLYHLLAVSGQNVAYVVAGILLAAWLAGVPRWLGQVGALAAVLGYVAAVGWQPSVVRAGVAGGLATLAWLAARPGDRWYFALVGAALLLAWNPYSLLDAGFQLSFAAVAAIFLLVPRLERSLVGYPVPRRLAAIVALSAACAVATAPILWLHFGAVSIVSVLANALAAPVVAPILGLGLGAAAVGAVLPGAAAALGWLNGWLVSYLAWCARVTGGLPFAEIHSGKVLGGVAGAVIAMLAIRRLPRHVRGAALAGAAAVAVAVLAWLLWPHSPPGRLPPPTGLRVTFLDVGQGDAALLQVPEGAVLVDQGPPEAQVGHQLDRLGVERLAALVLTHPQRDHIGGAAAVLRDVPVGVVLDPGQRVESPFEREALREAAERRIEVIEVRAGQAFHLGRLRLRVLWPDDAAPPEADPNDYAVVLLASYGSIDLLLTADAEANVTGRLPLRAVEALKVAHHGSRDDGLGPLLERLRARVAVISVGAGNDYGHPTPSTLATLAQAPGLAVYRTDRDGAVVIESDGRLVTVRTEA
jgi:competence protein ComEC